MFDLTTEQVKTIMNEVKSRMEDLMSFTRKDIFDYLSEDFDDDCYSNIREEFDFVVDRAVKEVGGYVSEFVEDEDGRIVYTYKPLFEDDELIDVNSDMNDEDDECDCDSCEENNEEDDDYTEDEDNDYTDEDVMELTVGDNNRIYISRSMFEKANMADEDVFAIVHNDDEIILCRCGTYDNEKYAYRNEKNGSCQVCGAKRYLGAEEYDTITAEISDGMIRLTR